MVLVSREEKRAIFTYLLREGVIVVRKDSYLPEHQHVNGVHNLKVMMTVKSLVSRGYLQQVFNWQWTYYTVTNKGVTFLAKSLGKSTPPRWPVLMRPFCRCVQRRRARHLQEEEDRRGRPREGRGRRREGRGCRAR